MNPVSWSVSILIFLLFGACLFLLWRYADWTKPVKAGASVLTGLLVLSVLVPALFQPPRYELAILPAQADASVPTPSEPTVSVLAPEPAPIATESDPVPESAEPEPEPVSEPEAAPEQEAEPPAESVPPPAEVAAAAASVSPAPAPVGTRLESSYVLNTSSKKFHRPSCSDAGRIKEDNRATANSRDDAINQGYAACKRCKP